MRNAKTTLVAAAIVTALSLTACSSTQPAQPAQPAPQSAPAAPAPVQQTAPAAPAPVQQTAPAAPTAEQKISTGAKGTLTVLGALKADIEKGDAAKAKTDADALEDSWSVYEDDVKAKDKDLYAKIEEQLDPLTAGAKAATLDKKVLSDAAAKLEALLTPLAK